jgi:phosphonate transport system substrate-binding protein
MTTEQVFSFTTIQAPIQDFIIEDLAAYVAERMEIPSRFVIDIPWQERERLIDSGQIDVAWICGLPYVGRVDRGHPNIELLAAPVMVGERYNDQPIYFSDVIVRAERPFKTFEDLRGTTWAYNEPGSQSGYNITRYHLATIGAPAPFFGRVIEAGSHERCIQLVIEGEVDAAAIDSTVLEMAREQDGLFDEHLRVLTALGPSPIPPLVISGSVDPERRDALRALLLKMHKDPNGRQLLEQGKIRRFQHVRDSDYDPIRVMAQKAQDFRL